MRLEEDVPQVQDGGQQPVDAVQLVWSETQDVHGIQQTPEVLSIILPLDGAISSLTHTNTQRLKARTSKVIIIIDVCSTTLSRLKLQ